ncbi:MAG: hypothetical protein ACOYK8_06075 [Alphaproteobacteria bacterium]
MKLLRMLLLGTALTLSLPVLAAEQGHEHAMNHPSHQELGVNNTVKLELSTATPLQAGKTTQVLAKLSNLQDHKPISFDDFKEVHTKKLHLLIIDPSLSDYHHIHPVAGKKAGEYLFDFTPEKNDQYIVWADILPAATGKQEYVKAHIGAAKQQKAPIDKTEKMVATVAGFTFTLALEGEPKAGEAVMGHITVTKNGQPFNQLQPVMGAFAHVVGFSEDYNSVLHVHPMGVEPSNDSERGGPVMDFHIEPKKAGFVKLFAQVHIDGKDIFAPFGIMVK